ncbi:hypothetical protein [Pseudomonas phage Astolliot]|nr:hypothetical protein [Pseudomonas phage Astolliot]
MKLPPPPNPPEKVASISIENLGVLGGCANRQNILIDVINEINRSRQ